MMPRRVRSDVQVAYFVLAADGTLQRVGRFQQVRKGWDVDIATEIPHLHRVSPDGAWLASFDASSSTLVMRASAGPQATKATAAVRRIRVRGLSGVPKTLRWRHDSSGLVLHTARGLFRVDLAFASSPRRLRARRILNPRRDLSAGESVLDFRMLPGAVLVRTETQLWRLSLSADEPALENLTPPGHRVTEAGVLSDGRVAMLAHLATGQEPSQLWILSTAPGTATQVLAHARCKSCTAAHWAPRAADPIMASYSDVLRIPSSTLAMADGRAQTQNLTLALSDDDRRIVHSLWAASDGRILAANSVLALIWDGDGNPLWQWRAPAGKRIVSARFEPSSADIVVGTKRGIYRISADNPRASGHNSAAPGAIALLSDAHRARIALFADKDAYLDDVIPLADGAIAFAVVREHSRYGPHKPRKRHKQRRKNGKNLAIKQ